MNLDLDGKVVLVTGSARDVGREIALAFAAEGATVAVNYNNSANAAGSVVGEITESGGTAKTYRADVSDLQAVRTMVDAIIGDYGRIDVLVNNAGFVEPKQFLKSGPEDWKRQIDIGLYGAIHCCHAVGAHMVERGGGSIVNLTGDSARVGEKYLSVTASARGGVLSLTKSLAREFGPAGITVNAVALGLVETAHNRSRLAGKEPRAHRQAVSAAPDREAGGRRPDHRFPGVGRRGMDYRAGAQHQRRLQHGGLAVFLCPAGDHAMQAGSIEAKPGLLRNRPRLRRRAPRSEPFRVRQNLGITACFRATSEG